ncbi:1-deoxy-D-xylulose 5-phosphate reductoisomerase [Isosphaera pallida ATCC 43644]|uniref:1-deoxy-D-xylulose 5-phosphate reductoisomerase n=1 Tax=Isosphaera pallida (strain ATCC 43644 / DSM 9630 / IS1B) TaxID=575540 RepID=E8R4G0_ISOPI|nr:1-deoxy-D-xylulose-5-phosphate reductoisomerase [Isosphaera pallida]ADV63755.1 1-deoxy-D-xylulose 5-phosphate reductoisomerase [Isosphaera pallida ATCC 43644]
MTVERRADSDPKGSARDRAALEEPACRPRSQPHGTRTRREDEPPTCPIRVVILGSTGSIGRSTLEVLSHDAQRDRRFELLGLAAGGNWAEAARQVREHRPRIVAMHDAQAAQRLEDALRTEGGPFPGRDLEIQAGPEAVANLAAHPQADRVISAIVGAAGLRATWAAVAAGKLVGLANKESLVVAGALLTDLARRTGATLLPVDSEHSAIFQALASGDTSEVKRVILTASGGPFRGRSAASLARVTPAEALRHPTWAMGPKITIDSATLMNKALEVIEARWLFDLAPEQIDVVVHPQSVVHSMVEFRDGSTLAQLSPPDMKLPIQYALSHPRRWEGPCRSIDWTQATTWTFEPPDREAFPCLDLGLRALRDGGTAPAALNAANEAAVSLFLEGTIGFNDIPRALSAVLDHHPYDPQPSLDRLWEVDAWARNEVLRKWIVSSTSSA